MRRPATRKEEALWLLEKFVPGTGVNNLSVVFQVDGELEPAAVRETLDHLLARHAVLRTVFDDDGGLWARTLEPGRARVELEEAASAGGPVAEELRPFIAEPFRQDGSLLVRARLLGRADGDVLCVAVHHSVFDGLSAQLFLGEFTALYEAFVSGHRPPPELRDEVPAWREPEAGEGAAAYWREQLAGFRADGLGLANERQGGAVTTLAGDEVTVRLAPGVKEVVARLQRELRAPEAVVLLAAYYLLLAAHGAGPDLTVGSPVSLRDRGAQGALGYHINVLTLRLAVDAGESFRELVARARKVFLGGMTHAAHPVDELLSTVGRSDAAWRNLLFRHVFNYAPLAAPADFALDGQRATQLTVENGSSKFDLEFFVTAHPDALTVRAAYCTEVFERADVELMVRRYEELLLALGEDPDRPVGGVPVWCERDRRAVGAANTTGREVPWPTVAAAVARAVAGDPDAVAVEDGERRVTRGELWAAAEATRALLADEGVGAGDVVALAGRRGAETAAAVLGVWLAGAAYLPVDPDHPEQRIAYQLTDSGAKVVLAGPGVTVPGEGRKVLPVPGIPEAAGALPDPAAVAALAGSGDLAYLIYTSGSTGRPKGTLVGHGALANLVAHFAAELAAGPDDTTLWLTTFSFDISALELYLPLVTGGRLAVAPDEARTNGAVLRELLERHRVTVVQATPTTWRLVLPEAAGRLAGLRVLSGGEPLPGALAAQLAATGCELRNVYGPTETTVWSTAGRVRPGGTGRVGVGTPIANTRVFVAGPDGRELPPGVRGELCIAGTGVAAGYHDRPGLTAERFGVHPVHGRHYRTGDLARWLPEGTLEILGRLDRQIKLRGNRIELGEVEAVLLEHPDVRAAAVVVAEDAAGEPVLAAFVVGPDRPEAADELWAHARGALPLSAVPQEYAVVDAFPMTGNDKVDYPALTREVARRRAAAADTGPAGADPGDPVVARLTGLWRETLQREDVDGDTNFFAAGGHSLLGATLVMKLEAAFGVKLKLTDLFDNPQPAAFARRLRELAPRGTAGESPAPE
ncbi:amino acid adenylation domain-containing protein [Streptomyces luteireticuli]|uniref:Carrier domain-containing protein n=1 Tax=Streptomyces luteireticuli TaxID=173858 RepID=A0ABN0YMZ3_9ACTN